MDILKNIKEILWFLLFFFQFLAPILSNTDISNYIDIWESWRLENKHLNALIFELYITINRYKYFSASTCLPSLCLSLSIYLCLYIHTHTQIHIYNHRIYIYIYMYVYQLYTHTSTHTYIPTRITEKVKKKQLLTAIIFMWIKDIFVIALKLRLFFSFSVSWFQATCLM